MFLQTSFSVTWRVLRFSADWVSLSPLNELELWVSSVEIKLKSLISTAEDQLKVLQFLYQYKHLDEQNLFNLLSTDLILHWVCLIFRIKSYNICSQKRWSSHTEWWMRKLVQNEIDEEMYEHTQTANERLSDWNSQIVMINKVNNFISENESRTTFNYSNIKETMSECYLELMFKVHDYLTDPHHNVYFMTDIKYNYYNVLLHSDDQHIFAFIISDIEQLQLIQMSQRSCSARFIMSELMNITLESILSSDLKPSLLHLMKSIALPQVIFYIDDIFESHMSFDAQFDFLERHFFPQIEWVKMKLSFKKLHLFISKIRALDVNHIVDEEIKIIEKHIRKIIEWSISINVCSVRAFLKSIFIMRQWVKNFAEIARSFTRLTEDTEWKWTESESLFFDLLHIKCTVTVSMYEIDWSIQFHFYSDASGYVRDLVITQFQILLRYKKSAEMSILYDVFTFNQAECHYSTYKRELCVIVKFVVKHNHLLWNSDSKMYEVLHTDHMSLICFLKLELHDEIYEHWVTKLQKLNVKLQYIKRFWNKMMNSLSRIIFRDKTCTDNSVISALRAEVNKHQSDSQWFWKDRKGEYDSFLEQLTESEKEKILISDTINELNVFALNASFLWFNIYQASEWFSHTYHFVWDSTISISLHEFKCAIFIWKCLDYQIDKNEILWTYQWELYLSCISESKIVITLHETYDDREHWAKESTLIKLQRNVYWPSQFTDVERYIAECLSCACHESVIQLTQLQFINVAHLFQLIEMDFIGSIRESDQNKYILHIIDYFSQYFMTYSTLSVNAENVKICLLNVFHWYVCSSTIYCDREQHFDNQYIKNFLNRYNVCIYFSSSDIFKFISIMKVDNCILKSVIQKSSDKWDDKFSSSIKQLNVWVIDHLKYSSLEILHDLLSQPLQRQTYSQITDADTDQLINLFTQHLYQSEAVEAHLFSLACLWDEISEWFTQKKESEKKHYNREILQSNELKSDDLAMLYQKNVEKLQSR